MGMEAFFFAGGLYARYDKPRDRVDDGYPLPIGETGPEWLRPGLPMGSTPQ